MKIKLINIKINIEFNSKSMSRVIKTLRAWVFDCYECWLSDGLSCIIVYCRMISETIRRSQHSQESKTHAYNVFMTRDLDFELNLILILI